MTEAVEEERRNQDETGLMENQYNHKKCHPHVILIAPKRRAGDKLSESREWTVLDSFPDRQPVYVDYLTCSWESFVRFACL